MRHVLPAALAAALLIAAASPSRAAGDAEKGKAQFAICRICHSLDAGKNMVGPSLHGLFGRTSGTAPGFSYSAAMKAKAVVWSEDTLNQYLTDPKAYVPGNKMAFAGVKSDTARADLIAYLKQATQ